MDLTLKNRIAERAQSISDLHVHLVDVAGLAIPLARHIKLLDVTLDKCKKTAF